MKHQKQTSGDLTCGRRDSSTAGRAAAYFSPSLLMLLLPPSSAFLLYSDSPAHAAKQRSYPGDR